MFLLLLCLQLRHRHCRWHALRQRLCRGRLRGHGVREPNRCRGLRGEGENGGARDYGTRLNSCFGWPPTGKNGWRPWRRGRSELSLGHRVRGWRLWLVGRVMGWLLRPMRELAGRPELAMTCGEQATLGRPLLLTLT